LSVERPSPAEILAEIAFREQEIRTHEGVIAVLRAQLAHPMEFAEPLPEPNPYPITKGKRSYVVRQ
jgi:hypothetical protein